MSAARWLLPVALVTLTGCESAYYGAMERVGVHKREILVDRVAEAQASQEEGQEVFKSALERFRFVVEFDGGDLEEAYESLNAEYEDSVDAAERIRSRIESVESVGEALFEEWEKELGEYTSDSLRRDSERQLRDTRQRYDRLVSAMRRAEASIEPVLASLKDNVLYLKHNLNARAIASLKGELGTVNTNVDKLIADMQRAIEESSAFIREMRG
ncbi:MAG: DUF2959 domain-containing protein [Gammaproteobacteria bacterium]|nr:DUF2959 domain-containing protein [Gammaproteobacteria bacterium]